MIKISCRANLLWFLLLATAGLQAQNISKSPYSIVGLGEIVYTGNAQTYALGMCNQGIRSPYSVNYLNPASYSAFATTNIEAGGTYSGGSFKGAGTGNADISTAWIAYFNFGIPINTKKGMGISFGAAPFSSVGYNIQSRVSIPQDTFSINALNSYVGRGGLSKFYAGYGMRLHRTVSVGVNGNYVYGEITNTTKLLIPSQYKMFNTNEDKSSFVNGWIFDLGTQIHDTFTRIKKNEKIYYDWTIGGTYMPQANLNAEQNYLLRSMPIGSSTGTRDTILAEESASGTITGPASWRVGFNFSRQEKWSILADVRGTQWTNYQALGAKDSLRNSMGASLGFSFIPDVKGKNFVERIEYRIGARYEKSNLEINGVGVDVRALTAGIGLPLGRTRSKLNLGVELMQRGTTQNGLVQEDYFRFYLGITFADRWFYRYRYD
jgi:long-subunit fatty acid transport protein